MSEPELNENRDVYETRKGVAVRLRLFSPVLQDKVRQSVEFPEVPVYVATTAGGGKEEHPYTADMVESDDEKAMWAEYQAKRLAANLTLYERLGRLALIRGTDPDIPEGWEQEQELYGITVPEDPTERKLHWLETEAVESNDDLSELVLSILQYQNIKQEDRAAAAASFPDPVGGNGGPAGDTTGGPESERGAVASE